MQTERQEADSHASQAVCPVGRFPSKRAIRRAYVVLFRNAILDGRLAGPQHVGKASVRCVTAPNSKGVKSKTPSVRRVATLLDGSGAAPGLIAGQLGHSRVSMTQDVYLGRRVLNARNLARRWSHTNPRRSTRGQRRPDAFVPSFVPAARLETFSKDFEGRSPGRPEGP